MGLITRLMFWFVDWGWGGGDVEAEEDGYRFSVTVWLVTGPVLIITLPPAAAAF